MLPKGDNSNSLLRGLNKTFEASTFVNTYRWRRQQTHHTQGQTHQKLHRALIKRLSDFNGCGILFVTPARAKVSVGGMKQREDAALLDHYREVVVKESNHINNNKITRKLPVKNVRIEERKWRFKLGGCNTQKISPHLAFAAKYNGGTNTEAH